MAVIRECIRDSAVYIRESKNMRGRNNSGNLHHIFHVKNKMTSDNLLTFEIQIPVVLSAFYLVHGASLTHNHLHCFQNSQGVPGLKSLTSSQPSMYI